MSESVIRTYGHTRQNSRFIAVIAYQANEKECYSSRERIEGTITMLLQGNRRIWI